MQFWEVLEPSNRFNGGHSEWYVDAICDHLSHLFEIKRLLVNIPPRHTKSLLCSVFFPVWLWLQDPTLKVLCCSYSLGLAKELSMKSRRLVESPLYQRFYSEKFQLEADQNTQLKFSTTKTGYRQATSIESGTLGLGGDVIIFDDPNDVASINSKSERDKVTTFWREVLSSRVNNQPGKTARVVVQQRCHPEDLSGYILEHDCGEWTKLILPFEFDKSRSVTTSIGWSDPRQRNGQPLSNRIPSDEIEIWKREKRKAWRAQYNQDPASDDGSHFKREDFRYFTEDDDNYYLGERVVKKKNCFRFVSTDLAISLKTTADWSVFAIVDITPDGDLIVPRLKRDRLTAGQLVQTFKSVNETYKPAYHLVEQVGFQDFAIQQLRAEGITIRPVRPTTDKLTRSTDLQVKVEAGRLWLPEKADWTKGLEDELIGFPNGKNDDMVDTLAWAAQEATRKARKLSKPTETVPLDGAAREKWMADQYSEAILQGLF
ncbi:phage terminase large subunit [Zavarzinella formosa]|uniref:phage terminase large subunit n=1 Tax=Zavarzinella formosa TaxID=360055 RepID=UPI0002EA7DA2|nr:phage terminase large subunit [Zavarzinella formosa]